MTCSGSSFVSDFSTLTSEQKKAVLHKEGPALVIAGAGSGKTKVVTLRLAHLIEQGMDPSSFVAVTFTNKAAGEMRERIEAYAGRSVLVSTFHSLGAKILREYIHLLGYHNDFIIYDAEESEKALKAVLRESGGSFEDELSPLQSAISRLKNGTPIDTTQVTKERAEQVFALYQALLRRSQAVDFDDLIYLPLQLFQHHKEVLYELQKRWPFLLVDEYQDANDTQSELVEQLAGATRNIFAVGDPDQSIYSWRGANIQHILKFQEKFQDAKLFRLEQNFRSTETILSASNAVIEQNMKRIEKKLWCQNGKGEKIGCFVARTEREESSFVGDSIESLLQAHVPSSHIAILYRTNAQSRSIEDALLSRFIPYRIVGGLSFYERREIKDILSYLRLLIHPNDMMAFERAVTHPKRGLGATTIQKLIQEAKERGCSFLDLIYALCSDTAGSFSLPEKQKKGLQAFYATLQKASQSLSEKKLSQALFTLIQESGYLAFLEGEPETQVERQENLEQLVLKAEEWQEEHKEEPFSLFLEAVTLDPSKESEAIHDEDRITLMTAHNAKGLEFEKVFIIGMEEDLFPHIHCKMGKGEVEEERRLFYVAMTRAKKTLTLSCSQTRLMWGGIRSMRPSRFLKEIPREHLSPLRSPLKATQPISITEEKPKASEDFPVGTTVFHTHFGVGRVEKVIPSPNGELIKVLFSKDNSSKTLLKDVAPIRKLS